MKKILSIACTGVLVSALGTSVLAKGGTIPITKSGVIPVTKTSIIPVTVVESTSATRSGTIPTARISGRPESTAANPEQSWLIELFFLAMQIW